MFQLHPNQTTSRLKAIFCQSGKTFHCELEIAHMQPIDRPIVPVNGSNKQIIKCANSMQEMTSYILCNYTGSQSEDYDIIHENYDIIHVLLGSL